MRVLAIDPGNTESAYAIVDSDRRAVDFDKLPNADLLRRLPRIAQTASLTATAIEMVASYGMAVGKDVFETCVWTGRFYEALTRCWIVSEPALVYRRDVKLHHCHSGKATDANVKQALVDRFASGVRNHGKGTKAAPGWFYGFHRDIWQAYALAVYVADTSAPLILDDAEPYVTDGFVTTRRVDDVDGAEASGL